MSRQLIIIGAGMAGLLAARMLAHRKPVVWEKQAELPNNHHALLRFATPQVGDVLGIPFKSVNMIKAVLPWRNAVADSLAYSYKNTQMYRSDRSISGSVVNCVQERWIAPPDLIERMAVGANILYNSPFELDDIGIGATIISTMPMHTLAHLLQSPHAQLQDFKWLDGRVAHATAFNCDAYATIMIPDPASPISRISVTGDQLIAETTLDESQFTNGQLQTYLYRNMTSLLGIHSSTAWQVRHQNYQKILPIDNTKRKNFMFWATDSYEIYSLGRFATWRPGLLLDDLVKDIRMIDRWIDNPNKYDIAKHRSGA